MRHHLVNVNVGSSWNARDAASQVPRYFVVRLGVSTHHLQIDRRRQTEIDDLAGDVCRLKEKVHVRELFVQPFAKTPFVLGRRPVMFLIERDKDFAVRRRNRRDVSLGDSRPTVRNSNVVDQHLDLIGGNLGPNLPLDGDKTRFRFLDPRPRRTARVQAHLAGIDVREEVLTDQL